MPFTQIIYANVCSGEIDSTPTFTLHWLMADWFLSLTYRTKIRFMKKILIALLACITYGADAQIYNSNNTPVRRDTPLQMPPTIYSNQPGQFPNYYQNNSMFSNNSMQYNPPQNPKAGPYTGTGDYLDPTKNSPAPATNYNNSAPVMRSPAPANTPGIGK